MTVNNGFFDICENANVKDGAGGTVMNICPQPASLLSHTGYERPPGGLMGIGGATRWLTTTAPVIPGETITLRFAVFDEEDYIIDSAVLLDNFRWDTKAVDAPVTGEIN